MKGIILDKGEKGFSLFGRVFDNINVLSEKYNWLISYPVCCPSDNRIKNFLKHLQKIMSGCQAKS